MNLSIQDEVVNVSSLPLPSMGKKNGEEVVARQNQSKYDFVKVRVWVEDHFYVLSRYLVCRALVSTKVCFNFITAYFL
jgi:hypothetical protein